MKAGGHRDRRHKALGPALLAVHGVTEATPDAELQALVRDIGLQLGLPCAPSQSSATIDVDAMLDLYFRLGLTSNQKLSVIVRWCCVADSSLVNCKDPFVDLIMHGCT